jgi:CBS domain-containing protein
VQHRLSGDNQTASGAQGAREAAMRHLAVREIMTDGAVCQASPRTSVRAACRLMAEHQCGSVLVTERGRLLGIFTQGDLVRRVLAPGRDPNLTLLVEVMTADPDTIRPRESVDEAIRWMDEYGYRHLPVIDAGAVVGMVALRDCSIEDLAAMHAELETRRVVAERAW